MNDQIIRGTEVTRPDITPLNSSILDHATVVTNDEHFGLRNNEGLWNSYNCLDLLAPTPICPNPMQEGEYKRFDGASWVPGFEFAVHGGVKCLAVGLDRADQKSEIERVFAVTEAKGVERALKANRFANLNPADPPHPAKGSWYEAIDLSLDFSAGLPLLAAFATLEGFAAAIYAGVPTIHAPRAAVLQAMALGAVVERDGKFYTKTGAKVAAGGGYDSSSYAVLTYDLYATGEVYVERSETLSFQSFVLPGDGSGPGSSMNGFSDNTSIALVERMYRVGVDCFTAKVTAKAWV